MSNKNLLIGVTLVAIFICIISLNFVSHCCSGGLRMITPEDEFFTLYSINESNYPNLYPEQLEASQYQELPLPPADELAETGGDYMKTMGVETPRSNAYNPFMDTSSYL